MNKWLYEVEIDFMTYPNAAGALNEKFKYAKRLWASQIKEARIPEWWKRKIKSDGGGIHKRKFYGGYRLFYSNSGKYDYMEVLERGRPRYDMKPPLLRNGKFGRNGMYRVIPIKKGGIKFRVINALSSGWYYPEIPKTDAYKRATDEITQYIESAEFGNIFMNDMVANSSNPYVNQYLQSGNSLDSIVNRVRDEVF